MPSVASHAMKNTTKIDAPTRLTVAAVPRRPWSRVNAANAIRPAPRASPMCTMSQAVTSFRVAS